MHGREGVISGYMDRRAAGLVIARICTWVYYGYRRCIEVSRGQSEHSVS